MKVKISSIARETMLALAAADPQNEVCGLLFGEQLRIDVATPARNVAENPRVNFEIDPAALIAAMRAERNGGARLAGYFHSHLNGLAEPSATDSAMAAHDGRIWLIIAGDVITAWQDSGSGFVGIDLR